jgi:hypothetical protein
MALQPWVEAMEPAESNEISGSRDAPNLFGCGYDLQEVPRAAAATHLGFVRDVAFGAMSGEA